MAIKNLYFICGNDTDMIEKKYLPDLFNRFPKYTRVQLDPTVDTFSTNDILTEYYSSSLFSQGKIIIIRNSDKANGRLEELANIISNNPNVNNVLVLLGEKVNKTTRLGKTIKKHFNIKEFSKPEIKPFELLDAISTKNITKIILQSEKLKSADTNYLGLYSLLCSHFILLKQLKERQHNSYIENAKELKQHQFKIKKAQIANKYWSISELNKTLEELRILGDRLRSWQYDPWMLIRMSLIKASL